MTERLLNTDWVICPICGEDNMRRETYVDMEPDAVVTPETRQYHRIFCHYNDCGSNGGYDFSNVEDDEHCCEEDDAEVIPEFSDKTWADVSYALVHRFFHYETFGAILGAWLLYLLFK